MDEDVGGGGLTEDFETVFACVKWNRKIETIKLLSINFENIFFTPVRGIDETEKIL